MKHLSLNIDLFETKTLRNNVERLEVKRIKGKEYYYYSEWGWKGGKCRRIVNGT